MKHMVLKNPQYSRTFTGAGKMDRRRREEGRARGQWGEVEDRTLVLLYPYLREGHAQ